MHSTCTLFDLSLVLLPRGYCPSTIDMSSICNVNQRDDCSSHLFLVSILEAMAAAKLENEDILSDSLEFLGGKPVIDDSKILYGPLVLSLAPKVWFIP